MDQIRCKFVRGIMQKRTLSMLRAHRKRFYNKVDIQDNAIDGGYFIQLDGKTIKTPLMNKLYAPTKTLALAVSQEWYMQTEEIDFHKMPLTTICNTAIDNPNRLTKVDLIGELLKFLHTDTICSIVDEPEQLVQYQNKHWKPVRDWFSERYQVIINASPNLFTLEQSNDTINKMADVLTSQNNWQLYALQSAVDCLKSFILPMAVVENHLNVEDAVYLSRLEQEYQIEKWGKFEGAHDIELYNLRTHVSAAALFYQLSNEDCNELEKP